MEITLYTWISLSLVGLVLSTLLILVSTTFLFLRSYVPDGGESCQDAPLITILKPLKGLDYELEENLLAFLELDGPSYEVLFGIADPQDPAVVVVESLLQTHPQAPFRLIMTDPIPGRNPKMINLMGLEPYIQGDLVLISDANTRPQRDSLRRLVWAFRDPAVGYGCAPFFVRRSRTLGARLRALHIGSQLVSWICGLYPLTGVAPIMGKWMVFRRQALADIGGFRELSHYLAADGMTGELLQPFGWRGVIIPDLIDISFGTWTVTEAWSQLLRWARLIRFLHLFGPLNLLVWNGTFWWGVGVLSISWGEYSGGIGFWVLGLCCWGINGLVYGQRGGDLKDVLLLPILDLQQIMAVVGAYRGHTIQWRDRQFQVGQGARIVAPLDPAVSEKRSP